MTRRAIGILSLLVLVSSAAGATGGVVTDGYWWDVLPNDVKGNVMTGATAAYQAGWRSGLLAGEGAGTAAITRSSLSDDQKIALGQRLRNAAAAAISGHAPTFDGKQIPAYVDGMNEFYVKHPNVSDLDFSAVFACIQDKPSRTCDAVAADYAKSRAASP
jgi:hypothetical protein